MVVIGYRRIINGDNESQKLNIVEDTMNRILEEFLRCAIC